MIFPLLFEFLFVFWLSCLGIELWIFLAVLIWLVKPWNQRISRILCELVWRPCKPCLVWLLLAELSTWPRGLWFGVDRRRSRPVRLATPSFGKLQVLYSHSRSRCFQTTLPETGSQSRTQKQTYQAISSISALNTFQTLSYYTPGNHRYLYKI